jgi:hypothetical protein
MWLVSSILANLLIMRIEYYYRVSDFSWDVGLFVRLALMIPVMQLCLWNMFAKAPSLMLAWACFTLGNTLLRLVNAYWFVGEPPNLATLAGVACILLGVGFIKVWG